VDSLTNLLCVAIGGGIGSVTRYLTSVWAAEKFGADFPYGTLAVNVAGCFIIGLFMVFATEKYLVSPHWRLLVTSGFLGGLTTFSSFSYETLILFQDGSWQSAATNLMLNLITGLLATWVGIMTANSF
jgi:fluoride exporter